MQAFSPNDAAFLWLETRNQPMHVAGLNIYTPPPGAGPDFVRQLVAEWGEHVRALPPFNQHPVFRLGLWYWDEDKDFELDYHLRHIALPQPGRIRELLAMVSRLHGNLLDRNRPLWETYVIEGLPGGRFAVYSKVHHAMFDGVSGVRVATNALCRSPDERKPPTWHIAPPQHPTARHRDAPTGWLHHINSLVQAGKEILPGVGSGLWDVARASYTEDEQVLPFQAPPTPFNVEISGSRRFAAQSYSLARLQRIGQAAHATVNDVTLAICAGALRQYLQTHSQLPKKPLVAMVPVSLHGETDAGGNQITLILANLATHVADPVKRLQRIAQSTTQAKNRLKPMPRLQKMAHGIASISPFGAGMVTGAAQKHPPFNIIISNVPGPREPLFLQGATLDEVYPVSIPSHYLALNITICGYGDQLGFGFIACRRSVPSLQRMLDYTRQAIDELEAALGLAPQGEVPPPQAKAPRRRKASSTGT